MEDNAQAPAENLDTPVATETVQEADWRGSVPEEYRSHPSLAKFKSPGDVFKSYVELEKYVGYDKVPLPKKPEDWDVVYDRLGRPKTPDEYKLPEMEMPEGFPQLDQAKKKEFLTLCHKKGILPSQAGDLYSWFMKDTVNAYTQRQKSLTDGIKVAESNLRGEWGAAYDNNINFAKRMVKDNGSPELTELLDTGLGNNPHFIKFLAGIGKKMSEDGFGGGKGTGGVMSPEEAKGEIARMQGDLKGPLYNNTHPEHKIAVKKMEELFSMAYPEEPKGSR